MQAELNLKRRATQEINSRSRILATGLLVPSRRLCVQTLQQTAVLDQAMAATAVLGTTNASRSTKAMEISTLGKATVSGKAMVETSTDKAMIADRHLDRVSLLVVQARVFRSDRPPPIPRILYRCVTTAIESVATFPDQTCLLRWWVAWTVHLLSDLVFSATRPRNSEDHPELQCSSNLLCASSSRRPRCNQFRRLHLDRSAHQLRLRRIKRP